jgi:NAD(P)-dependent dehydrogenase (short-subunit alcohol dehydrogenase family)
MSQALSEAGAKAIALLDVKQELGDQAAAELHEATGIPVQFYNVDVRDAKAIGEVVANVSESLGSPDIVINSAGVVE